MIPLPGDGPSGSHLVFTKEKDHVLICDRAIKGLLRNSLEAKNVFSNFINSKGISHFALQMFHALVIILL